MYIHVLYTYHWHPILNYLSFISFMSYVHVHNITSNTSTSVFKLTKLKLLKTQADMFHKCYFDENQDKYIFFNNTE